MIIKQTFDENGMPNYTLYGITAQQIGSITNALCNLSSIARVLEYAHKQGDWKLVLDQVESLRGSIGHIQEIKKEVIA